MLMDMKVSLGNISPHFIFGAKDIRGRHSAWTIGKILWFECDTLVVAATTRVGIEASGCSSLVDFFSPGWTDSTTPPHIGNTPTISLRACTLLLHCCIIILRESLHEGVFKLPLCDNLLSCINSIINTSMNEKCGLPLSGVAAHNTVAKAAQNMVENSSSLPIFHSFVTAKFFKSCSCLCFFVERETQFAGCSSWYRVRRYPAFIQVSHVWEGNWYFSLVTGETRPYILSMQKLSGENEKN